MNTPQKRLLKELSSKFFDIGEEIRAIIVRGSIAKGSSDRVSDVDLLIITKDENFMSFVKQLDQYLLDNAGSLSKNGWVDSIVPNFGGIGFVYMLDYESQLIQLDLYVLPEENAQRIINFSEKRFLKRRGKIKYKKNVDLENHRFKEKIKNFEKNRDKNFQVLFEVLLLAEMLVKNIKRRHVFLAYKYRNLLNTKMLFLIRTILEPKTLDYMFCDVYRQLGKYNSSALRLLDDRLRSTNVFSIDEVIDLFDIYQDLIMENFPKVYKENKVLIEKVRKYIEDKKMITRNTK